MLEALVTIMSSSGIGAITGGVFGWLNRREDRKVRRADQHFKLQYLRASSNLRIGEAEAQAFTESQKTVSRVGDAIKSAVRPVITAILLYMTFNILMQLETLTGGISTLPPEQAAALYREIVLNIISLTAMSVSWWFASRPSSIASGTENQKGTV